MSDVFFKEYKRTKPDFSHLFLNAGAHIQHHYLFNSSSYTGDLVNPEWYCPEGYDPLLHVLTEYDITIQRILNMEDVNIVVATGLHQVPHAHSTYYWRLNKHDAFLNKIGIKGILEVIPRMSRDFLVKFTSKEYALLAEDGLNSYKCLNDSSKIFSIDNRGDSLFIELIYEKNIEEEYSIVSSLNLPELNRFKEFVSFVAIKNGEHNGTGYIVGDIDVRGENSITLKNVKQKIIELVNRQ